ncbi:single-stranded DNA-binding protein [Vespertilionid gammaherpesvirus 1]|uniref:Single-stranded DNA-binding protein n=1 Tax=Vespertilionid gammaherpesvirus 1 TaxID=2560830 RepID=A0A0X9XD13_9GAMA|nr:single-stranded DNA-binding protein [Myotis gammaherpesvirus 8]AMA67366.1 single-stranded DNA-binding protein [Vespertilionid gammaherpesvirus 1]
MNSKILNGPVEDNVGTKAQIGPVGFIYTYSKETFPIKEASLLGDYYADGNVFSLPLLCGLTVESDFQLNTKAVHRKLDTSTISVRATAYHKEVIVFKNASIFKPIFQGKGLETLCETTRRLFGFSSFKPTPIKDKIFNIEEIYSQIPNIGEVFSAVVITESFKERLYNGNLVPIVCQIQNVQIGNCEVFKIPLYDRELFSKSCNKSELEVFYYPEVSRYLYNSHYTGLAQALRVRDIDSLIIALEKQSVNDQYKLPKLYSCREFPVQSLKGGNGSELMIIDSVATELAVSYGLSFLEVPQESTDVIEYNKWPIFEGCEDEDSRLLALENWNAKQALHIHAQLFSTNSVLHIARVHKQSPNIARATDNAYNSYFLQHGLSLLSEPTQKENGLPSFEGIPASELAGSSYTLHHLVYAASFSPNLLARCCYYLQFAQHHKSSSNHSYNIAQYMGSAANSTMCDVCTGQQPAACINTLFYRLKDRFPPVVAQNRRDPYVITGVAGSYNDLDYSGNFANFRDKDEENPQAETTQKYTYWQLTQTVMDSLADKGISDSDEATNGLITDISSFLKVFKEIDTVVDTEVAKFINSMIKNNINYRENIKSIHHILQFVCNVFWQPPCSVFLHLYYRSLLTVIQDICLPICMNYEQENPSVGMSPGEWLKMHYQTLWSNFKGACIDKGVLTGMEFKITHSEPFCDFFDVDAALKNTHVATKTQVKISRALVTAPKMIKIKNRIMFSNSSGTESIQNAFVKPSSKNENYIVGGPYMKFLNTYHKLLFPCAKISPLFLWHTFSKKRQIPVIQGISRNDVIELANYIDYNSRMHDEMNVLDVLPDTLCNYARVRLNNAIFRGCGQTQFFATTLHCLTPKLQTVAAEEYPHVLENATFSNEEEYLQSVKNKSVTTVQSTARDNICNVGKDRPIITVPLVVNKYTGITGNSQIFQCANLGYFLGRGVDKSLIPESQSFKRQGNMAYMRRRHVFMTPIINNLVKKLVGTGTITFEIETIRKRIQDILHNSNNPNMYRDVVIQLVKSLGSACEAITENDLEYYLGKFFIIADDISNRIQMLAEVGGPWTEEWAMSILPSEEDTDENMVFENFEESSSNVPDTDEFSTNDAVPCQAPKKRKLANILGKLDL